MALSQIKNGIVFLALGAYLFRNGFLAYNERRMVANTPRSKIRSIAMGRVEVSGTVEQKGNKTVRDEFCGFDSVFFHIMIEELRYTIRGRYWVPVKRFCNYEDFFVRDDTGRVLVKPDGITAMVKNEREYSGNPFKPLPDDIKKYVKDRGVNPYWFGIHKFIKVEASYIKPGNQVYVLGTASPAGGNTKGGKEEALIILQKGREDDHFVISDKPKQELMKVYNKGILLGMGLGGLLMIAGLGLTLNYLGVI